MPRNPSVPLGYKKLSTWPNVIDISWRHHGRSKKDKSISGSSYTKEDQGPLRIPYLTRYYSHFVHHYDCIATPMTTLLKKKAFAWSNATTQGGSHHHFNFGRPNLSEDIRCGMWYLQTRYWSSYHSKRFATNIWKHTIEREESNSPNMWKKKLVILHVVKH